MEGNVGYWRCYHTRQVLKKVTEISLFGRLSNLGKHSTDEIAPCGASRALRQGLSSRRVRCVSVTVFSFLGRLA